VAEETQNKINTKDTVSTDVGVVHVMPKGYQGGAMPFGSHGSVVENKKIKPKKVKKLVEKKKVIPKPVVKQAPTPKLKPKPPVQKRNPHKRKLLMIVGVVVIVVMLIVATIVVLSTRGGSEPSVETPVIVIPEVETTTPIVEEEVETPVVVEEEDPNLFDREPTQGRDSDSDGLSDIEERLYGSNVRLPDTDRDGFLDGNEVFHGYDPLRVDPATLLDRRVVKEFSQQGISFILPSLWQVTFAEEPPGLSVEVRVSSGESMALNTEPRLDRGLEEFANAKENEVEYSVSKAGYELATSKDQMRAYLAVGENFITVEYAIGEKNSIDFVQTFQMIVNSIDMVSEPVSVDGDSL